MKKKSIHDIAREMKVSAATISFVLSGRGNEKRISKQMQHRVLKYVEETGYQPSTTAQSLRTGKTKTIGMLVENIADPFFSSIIGIVQKEAYKLGYRVFFSGTENKTEIARSLIKVLRGCRVDGYIIAPTQGLEKDIKQLLDEGYPLVIFDRYLTLLETDNVVVDNFKGAYNAAQHLVEMGFKNIGLVTLDSDQTQMQERLAGYAKAMEENNFATTVAKIPYNVVENQICEAITSFVMANKTLDAIFFTTNYLTLAGARTLRAMDFDIPADMAIVGFDDNPYFSMFTPSITTVAQPVDAIAAAVLARLIECIDHPKLSREKHTAVLPTKLIVRESCTWAAQKKNTKPKTRQTGTLP